MLIYFGLQTVLRVWISGTVDLDESEQLVLTQKFCLGYGSQPPLYTWMQMLFFRVFGVSVFALALLKNLLLFSIYLFTYLNVRFVTRSQICGALGAVSLLFIPQVSWESQRDLTHSILATASVVATLFLFLRLRSNSWSDYILFGVSAALGVLSKYNYLAFLFGLIVAATSLSRFRSVILNRRMLVSLGVCVLILSPHLFWALNHRELLATTTYKFRQQVNHTFIANIGTGLANLVVAVLFHIGPIVLIFAAFFRDGIFNKSALAKNEFVALFLRKYGFILAGLVLVILSFQMTGFKDRWFEPIFISLPILLFSLVQDQINKRRAKGILTLGVVVAATILIVIPTRIHLAEKLRRTQLLNAPYRQLKFQLAEFILPGSLVVAENKWVGGNLRMLFPELNVLTPELAKLYSATNRRCLVVWDATRRGTPSPALMRFVETFAGVELGTNTALVSGKYQFHRAKKFQLGISDVRERSGKF
ncbi:MAG: glycosyltransferase family 39 protein [Verrucomicrobiota bacterium]